MPRLPRFCPADYPVHVIQRGNNRQACFTCNEDIAAYVHWLSEGAKKYHIGIHAWVFMTNHIHLLMTPTSADGISKLMQYIGRLYVRRFNYRYARTGTLFDGRYKSSLVQDDQYLLNCIRYIELNPIRAGLVKEPGDYKWSSYRSHAHGWSSSIWTPHPLYLSLAKRRSVRQSIYRELMNQSLPNEVVDKITHCVNRGLVLGSEAFRTQVARMRH